MSSKTEVLELIKGCCWRSIPISFENGAPKMYSDKKSVSFMPSNPTEFRCLLISPSDVQKERDSLTKAVEHWNAQIGTELNARVQLVRFESHATPDLSDTPQAIINRQLVDDCDFGIAVFWSRLGTPTSDFESGSVEEVQLLLEKGKRVLVYFCTRAIPQGKLTDNQFARLKETRERFSSMGLVSQFSTSGELSSQLTLHLTKVVAGMLVNTTSSASEMLTASKPDVRLTVTCSIIRGAAFNMTQLPERALSVAVQNHSPVTVFTKALFFATDTGESVYIPTDIIGNALLGKRELRPGESITYMIDPAELKKFTDKRIQNVVLRDDIDREYYGDEDTLRRAVLALT